VEHFHYYTLGAEFVVRTDADGVRFIYDRANQKQKRFLRRAEGWAMRLNTFNYTIEFVKGTDNIADPSSRLFFSEAPAEEYDEGEMPCEIARITITADADIVFNDDHMPIQEVRLLTRTCPELQRVIQAIESQSWPKDLDIYESVRDELEVINDIVVRRGLVVPPLSLRAKALRIAHVGHQGMTKTKSVLKELVWWPRMNSAVEDWVAGCRACILTGRKHVPVPMQRTLLPEGPWDYVAIDHCGPFAVFGGVHVVCIVDYYTRYITAAIVKSTGWIYLKPVLDDVFGRLGAPAAIKSDNGPPFSGSEYRQYCDANGIERVFSFPLNPQQNGMAEAAMKHVNSAAQHAAVEGKSLRDTLVARIRAHNDAQHRETGEVPSQLLFGRRLRRGLPSVLSTHVQVDRDAMRERDFESKAKKKKVEDRRRRAKDSDVSIGDTVVLERAVKRKGDTRFDPEELIVTDVRAGDLTLQPNVGKPIHRDITKVRKLPEPPVIVTPDSPHTPQRREWPSAEEDMRPPSPFLTATQQAPEMGVEETAHGSTNRDENVTADRPMGPPRPKRNKPMAFDGYTLYEVRKERD
jgi:transposase InsO family protein